MDFWPKKLVTDLEHRKVVVMIGSGVSRHSTSEDGLTRPPDWKSFLESGLIQLGSSGTRHIKTAISGNDFLHACEWLKARLDEDWPQFLTSTFQTPGFKSAEIHDVIFRLDQRIVATPNIDDIYDRYVTEMTGGRTKIKKFFDDDAPLFLRDDSDYILKIHGSIDTTSNLIFTQKEYAEKRNSFGAFYSALDAAILSHTFLFIGCGIHDPDITLLLENNRFRFPGMPPHYFVTSSKMNSDLENSLRQNRNLKCIKYKSENNHAELLTRLKALAELVNP